MPFFSREGAKENKEIRAKPLLLYHSSESWTEDDDDDFALIIFFIFAPSRETNGTTVQPKLVHQEVSGLYRKPAQPNPQKSAQVHSGFGAFFVGFLSYN